jgi:hypothetical protein
MAKKDEILEVFTKNLKEILGAWGDSKFDPDSSIREMGVDSVDSFLILITSMKQLGYQAFEIHHLEGKTLNQIAEELASTPPSMAGKASPESELIAGPKEVPPSGPDQGET